MFRKTVWWFWLTAFNQTAAPSPPTPMHPPAAVPASGITDTMAALLTLVRRSSGDRGPLPAEWSSVEFAEALMSVAEHHGVLGLVLLEYGKAFPERMQQYKSTMHLLRKKAMLWDFERDAVTTALKLSGIEAVLLKGAALRLTAYQDSAQREFGDLDILLHSDQLAAAVEALTKRGYNTQSARNIELYLEHHHHLILEKPQGFKVELHWKLNPSFYPFRLDHDAVIQRATHVDAGGRSNARVPCAEDMVLHLSQQNTEESFAKLRRLIDIDRVIASTSGFNWELLAREATRLQLQPVVALSLRLCELLLGTAVPSGFIRQLRISRVGRVHLAILDPLHLVTNGATKPRNAIAKLMMLWCIQGGAAQRRRYLMSIASGRDDWFGREVHGYSHPSAIRDVIALVKIGTYQVYLYPKAAIRWLVGQRRQPLWSN